MQNPYEAPKAREREVLRQGVQGDVPERHPEAPPRVGPGQVTLTDYLIFVTVSCGGFAWVRVDIFELSLIHI